jgi:hypothetical protein
VCPLKIKIPVKNLGGHRCVEGFNSGVKGLTLERRMTYKDVTQWALWKLKSPLKTLGRQHCAEGFNSGVKGLIDGRYAACACPIGPRRRSTVARLLRSWVRILPGTRVFVCFVCVCVLSGRGLCDKLITRTEESYRLWRIVCDKKNSWTRRP